MNVQGCIKALALACSGLVVVGCTQFGPAWWRRSQPYTVPPSQARDQQTTHFADEDTPLTTAPVVDSRGIVDQVREYIDTFPQEDRARPTPNPARSVAQTTPKQTNSKRKSDQAGSMGPVSLHQIPHDHSTALPTEPPVLPVLGSVSVRAVADEQALPPAAEMVMANKPIDVGQAAPQASIGRDIERLEEQVKQQPNDLNKQLRLRYLYLAEGLTEKALSLPKDMDPERAVLLMKMMKSAVATEKALRDPELVSSETANAVQELQDWIRCNTDLEIPRVALCTRIHSYGRYQTIPDDFFVSGGSNRAFLYCEVKNFSTEPTEDGKYRTRIAHRLELLTPQGHSVWKDPEEMEVVDVCLNRRTDFFFNRLVQLPLGINPGDYVLKVTVEDKIKSGVDQASLLIEIKPAGSARK